MATFQKPLKKVGIFTSGGDAPGMNAALRASARALVQHQIEVVGILGGYSGMFEEAFLPLASRSFANVLQRGGTILGTGRCAEFMRPDGRAEASSKLKKAGIDALICIGGDGSFAGAHLLWKEHQIPIVGVPGTIDNDIPGTDNTIGFDTAVNTALDSIDRIRDTATSHGRIFIVEVMGRDSGFIAAMVGLAGGAEEVFTPEYPVPMDRIEEKLRSAITKGKKGSILVTAEGQKPGRAYDLAEQIRKRLNIEPRVCILGHTQRGGAPSATDRVLATRMGYAAAQLLMQGQCDVFVGTDSGTLKAIPIESILDSKKSMPRDFVQLASILAL